MNVYVKQTSFNVTKYSVMCYAAFIAPPSKTMVVVDFIEPSEARAAQKGLAYRNYKHTPLYLEWAPLHAIDRSKAAAEAAKKNASTASELKKTKDSKQAVEKANSGDPSLSGDVDNEHEYSSLFIKNLNFTTSEVNLRDHLLHLGVQGLRTVLIQKKLIGKNMLSQGYGFAEFKNPEFAAQALARLKGSLLDSHALDVKPSDKRLTSAPAAAVKEALSSNSTGGGGAGEASSSTNNKLIVRNVAFQATKSEIRDLFTVYGSVKRVRIPKKMGGEHRGFAFVDFSTAQEAAMAMASLKNTHLYGRHLVLEWAKEEDDQEGIVAEGLHNMNGAAKGNKGPGAAPMTAIDRLRKKARSDELVINMQHKRAKMQKEVAQHENDGIGSDDI
jgi:multiple RNA-binding domain-containing protein 1